MSQPKNEPVNAESSDIPISYAPIHTVCHGCIFQEMKDKSQTGCILGRIDKYKDVGVTVLEASNENNEEFFIINDRICMAKRSPYWKSWAEGVGMVLVEEVYKEMKMKYHTVIILEDEDLDKLNDSIESLKSQDPQPKHVTVVRTMSSEASATSDLRLLLDRHGFPWKIQALTVDMPAGEAVDLVVSGFLPSYRKKLPFYMCIDSGDVLPKNLMEKLDDKINKELLQFAVLELKPDTHSVISATSVHKFVGGNRLKKEYGDDKSTLKQEIQKEEECSLPVMSIEEIL